MHILCHGAALTELQRHASNTTGLTSRIVKIKGFVGQYF
jgi:hypothetical protein